MEQKIYNFTVLFTPAEEGGFVVTCPALPGVITEGDTIEEARAMAADAINGHLECLRANDLPIPKDLPILSEPVTVQAA
jgi:predicted RNase H-like HicB family nuclease